MATISIGASRCLLGERVRYDGGHKYDPRVIAPLVEIFDVVGVCPEAEAGLPVPREPAEIFGTPLSPRFVDRRTGRDWTFQILDWTAGRLRDFESRPVFGYVFKHNSPSCAVAPKPVFDLWGGKAGYSQGLFVRAFRDRFPWVPIADELELLDPVRLKRFMDDVRECAQGRI